MSGKSPMMKKLIGKQKNLPAELKAKIMAAPESPAKMYGKSPAKNYKNPQDYKVFNMGNEPTPMKQVKPTDKDVKKYSDYEKYDEDGKKITRKQKRAIKKEFKNAKKAGAAGTGKKKSPMKGYKSDAQRKAVHASKADGGKSPAKQSMKDRAKNVVNKAKNVGSKVVNAMAAPGDPRLKTNRKTDHGKKKSPAKQMVDPKTGDTYNFETGETTKAARRKGRKDGAPKRKTRKRSEELKEKGLKKPIIQTR